MSKKDEITYTLDSVIQSLINLRNAVLLDDDYKSPPVPPKYNIGELVYAKYVGANVVIEDFYYDDGWKYKFHGPSAVLDNDYYSTYCEDGLESAREYNNE